MLRNNVNSPLSKVDNDELQKKLRRLSKHVNEASRSPLINNSMTQILNSSNNMKNQSKQTISNDKINEIYSICIKLSTENKINIKNAFGLDLIDYMKYLLKDQSEKEDATDFQVASSTIDASAKIYSCRVDSVHQDTIKILANLGKSNDNQNLEENKNSSYNEDTSGGTENLKDFKKPKKRQKKISIETDLSNINLESSDFKNEDSSHFLMNKNALLKQLNSTYMNNLFIPNFIMESDDSLLKIFDYKNLNNYVADFSNYVLVDGIKSKVIDLVKKLSTIDMFNALETIRINDSNMDDRLIKESSFLSVLGIKDLNEHSFNESKSICEKSFEIFPNIDNVAKEDNNNQETILSDCVEFGEYLPDEDKDCSINIQNDDNNEFSNSLIKDKPLLELSTKRLEYSYFNISTSKLELNSAGFWNGPQHWKPIGSAISKLQKLKPKVPKFSKNVECPKPIDYLIDLSPPRIIPCSKKAYIKTSTSIFSNNLRVINQTFDSTNHFGLFNITNISNLKLSISINDKVKDNYRSIAEIMHANDELKSGDAIHNDLKNDINNENDNSFTIGNEFIETTTNTSNVDSSQLNDENGYLNLVFPQYSVEKLNISYEKTSKKIDARAIKNDFFDYIVHNSKTNQPISYMKMLYSASKNNTTLSTSIGLVCLLHLSNEKNLKIENCLESQFMKDLIIKYEITDIADNAGFRTDKFNSYTPSEMNIILMATTIDKVLILIINDKEVNISKIVLILF